jgi:general secretion pathway protein H
MRSPRSRLPRPFLRLADRSALGFTLIEVILVMVIIAAGSVMIVRGIGSGTPTWELKGGARKIAAAMRVARSEALTTRRETTVTIDLERREFVVSSDARVHPLPKAAEIKLFTADQEVVSETQGAIRFYGDGSSTGGRVTIGEGDRRFEVDVDWLTGRVRIL